MNKSIVISIKPEHALNILNGKKTLELRKSVPKDFKGWVYGYVTKGGDRLAYEKQPKRPYYILSKNDGPNTANATIPFRFWFDECDVLDIQKTTRTDADYSIKTADGKTHRTVIKFVKDYNYINPHGTCLTDDELKNYGNGKDLYAWHISKLEIFDKPMMLSEFNQYNQEPFTGYFEVKRPPQSWQYVWVKE